jgi:GrpB-like predicted nucleotidyltransferase (UPF0157 family)
MADPIVIVPHDPAWRAAFAERGAALRRSLRDLALRIDHIGSTAVPGLGAKDVIDVQVSVASLEPVDRYRAGMEAAGFAWRTANPDRAKRYFREARRWSRTHLHVVRAGAWNAEQVLLFRDHLRAHDDAAAWYEAEKRRLAALHRDDRPAYVEAKDDIVRTLRAEAEVWARAIGWEPGPSDA